MPGKSPGIFIAEALVAGISLQFPVETRRLPLGRQWLASTGSGRLQCLTTAKSWQPV